MLRGFAILLLAGLLGSLPACQEKSVAYPQRRVPEGLFQDQEQVAAGHALFLHKCVACHGKAREGRSERTGSFQLPAPDFTERHYRQADPAYLYWRIEQGKTVEPYRSRGSVMPAWGEYLSVEQTWQLVAYLKQRAQ